jgi:hypothetical protein
MMLFLKRFGAALFLLVATASFAADSRTTEQVWEHHIQSWEARDLTAIVSDYNAESVLIVNGNVFRGRAEIEQVFSKLFAIFDGGINRIDPPTVVGRIVYLTWHFTPMGLSEFYGTDSFVIEDGIISVQTIASPLYDRFPVN